MTSGRARASPGRGTELRYKVPMSLAKISSPWPLWIFIQPNICILNISLEIYGYKEINIVGYVCMYIHIYIYTHIIHTFNPISSDMYIYIYIESSIIQCVYVYIYYILYIYIIIYIWQKLANIWKSILHPNGSWIHMIIAAPFHANDPNANTTKICINN